MNIFRIKGIPVLIDGFYHIKWIYADESERVSSYGFKNKEYIEHLINWILAEERSIP